MDLGQVGFLLSPLSSWEGEGEGVSHPWTSIGKWLLAALTQGAGKQPGSEQGRAHRGGGRVGRGGQPVWLRSPSCSGHNVPHQQTDKEGSNRGPYPVNPVIVPVVCYQSWPEGSGRIHAGSGHATSERGTNQLCQPCGTRDRHPSPSFPGWGNAQAGKGRQRTPPGAPCQGSGPALGGWQAQTTLVPIQARLLGAWGQFALAAKGSQDLSPALLQHREHPSHPSPRRLLTGRYLPLQTIGENLAQGGSISAESILGLTGNRAFKQGKLRATRR